MNAAGQYKMHRNNNLLLESTDTLKPELEVTHGDRKWNHSIERI